MQDNIVDTLATRIHQMDAPIVVGIDPILEYIPLSLKEHFYKKYGHTTKAVSEIFFEFSKNIIDSVFDIVPCIKPQIAMFEMFGSNGIDAYTKTIRYAKQKGMIIISDIKRGDIASTAKSYSIGHLGNIQIENNIEPVFNSDFITVNPYLGYDSIEPFLEECTKFNKGLFVLVKTSNPNSGDIQDIITERKQPLYIEIAKMVNNWGADYIGNKGFSRIGAVVGATYTDIAKEIRKIMPHTFFLVPGYGSQGANSNELIPFFNKNKTGAIINNSRGIIYSYLNNKKIDEENYAKSARNATLKMIKEIQEF
ncbi:MAG: orotidine-5'-phosphate decarboxylase [Defluviitaleaceae bacterium]|nr:orotidine-5'-phosphate decarboxylase [Defluviitaleaceae bacterium]